MALMNKPSFEKFSIVYSNTQEFPSIKEVAKHFGVTRRSVFYWIRLYQKDGYNLEDRESHYNSSATETQLEIVRQKQEISLLKSALTNAQKLALSNEKLVSLIHGTSNRKFDKKPKWLTKSSKKTLNGIPLLFISDVHFDEYVDPNQINGVNEYSHDIAVQRIRNTFEKSVDVLTRFIAKPNYDGAIIALGGDMLSGSIHEELVETNEAPILSSILEMTQLLIDGINLFADKFNKVFVPCVVGNHGRLHKKPRHKNRVFDNYEWLIYQYLAKHFLSDSRVTFFIPDGPDAVFNIYDKTFLLTHGDQFKGGSGISGIFSSLQLGLHKKQKKQAAIHSPFDVMMIGHFHQYIHTNSLVVNGSIKGYDEFANTCNFPFEPAQQALWINHPEHGMVFRTPILCEKKPKLNIQTRIEVFK